MHIYFPIAELAIPLYVVILVGFISGVMAGLFGIGGNFITIPTLIFMGVTPTVALSSAINQTVASSFGSFLSQLKRKNVDLEIGLYLFLSGMCGTLLGSILLHYIKGKGFIDLLIFIIYIVMLSSMGTMVAIDSIKKLFFSGGIQGGTHIKSERNKMSMFMDKMPFKKHFKTATVEVSVLALVLAGIVIGFILSLSGVGGGFLLIPFLIYGFKFSTRMAIGTSVFQSVLIAASATFMHAVTLGTVDLLLSFLLSIGATTGLGIGIKLNTKLSPVVIRGLLAMVMFLGVFRLILALFVTPEELFSFSVIQ